MQKKLYKARRGCKIDGVCKGMADYFGMDPTLMRIIWVVGLVVFNFAAVVAYLICAFIMPREPEYYDYQ